MGNVFYIGFALVLAVLFISVLRLKGLPRLARLLLLLVIGALVYDNGIRGTGFLIGEGLVLKWLNIFRFVLHVAVTPLFCVLCLELARLARLPAAATKAAEWAAAGLAIALMAVGYVQDFAAADFVFKSDFGVLAYTHPTAGPPIAAIFVNFLSIATSVAIWRKTGWPGLCITSVLMLVLAGVPHKYLGFIPGNAGEIFFVSGFVLGLKRFRDNGQPAGDSAEG